MIAETVAGKGLSFIIVLNKSGGISLEQKTAAGFCSVVTGFSNYATQVKSI